MTYNSQIRISVKAGGGAQTPAMRFTQTVSEVISDVLIIAAAIRKTS